MRYARVLGCLVVMLLMSACSTQLGYRFADTLVEWELSEFAELNSQQQQQVDVAITELHYWHATKELPVYANQLNILRKKIADQSLTETDIANAYEAAFNAWQRAINAIEPYAITILPTLTEAQIEQIQAELINRQTKAQAELAEFESSEEQRAQTQKKALETLRKWVRRPTQLQERLIKDWSAKRIPTRALWLEYNSQWQQAFIETLQQRRQIHQFPKQLKELFYNANAMYSAELSQGIEHNRELTMALLVKLYHSLNARQRARVVSKLDSYVEDFNELTELFAERGPE